jgi:hypothetical protein
MIFWPLIRHPANWPDAVFHTVLPSKVALMAGLALALWRVNALPRNEPARLSRARLDLSMALVPVIYLLCIVPGAWQSWRTHEDYARISAHGQHVAADVIKIYETGCGKSGCAVEVKYRFTAGAPGMPAQPVTGYGYLGNSGNTRDSDAVMAARKSGHVLVVYDRLVPTRSYPDIGNCILGAGSGRTFVQDSGLWLGAITGLFVLTFGVLWRARRKYASGIVVSHA